ncbi:MAG: elongation factor G [Spirochaetes bacterium]|nr:elongation factor G [Spirochaetota bacterium]
MANHYPTSKIRNIVLLGHTGSGKTILLENILFQKNIIKEPGNIEKGNTVSDWDEEEKARKISLKSSIAYIEHENFKFNIIDVPGSADFVGEVRASLRVADGAILVVDGEAGVQIETIKHWNLLDKYNIPRIIFINKLDKPIANFEKVANDIKENFNKPAVPVELPIYNEKKEFIGVIDVIEMKSYIKEGNNFVEKDIPQNYKDNANKAHEAIMEAVAEASDNLIEKFLAGEKLTKEEILEGLLKTVEEGKFIPIICGSAEKGIGLSSMLRIAEEAFPDITYKKEFVSRNNENERIKIDPNAPFIGFCFKTVIDQFAGKLSYIHIISGKITKETELIIPEKNTKIKISKLLIPIGNKYTEIDEASCGDIVIFQKIDQISISDTICDKNINVLLPKLDLPQPIYSVAISSADKNVLEKIISNLNKFSEEDPTFKISFNPETHENVASGMGELHLDVYFSKVKKLLKTNIDISIPKINYKETIRKESEAKYRHKKQSGGHGQFGEVHIRVRPNQRGKGFNFINAIVGGKIPKQFIPGVEKGLLEGMERGVLASYPVVDIEVELFDGMYHPVDSSELSFKIAARQALKEALRNADPILLEPIMKLYVYSPEKYTGDIMSDLNSKRGKILGMDPLPGKNQLIKAEVPHAELLKYAIDLKSITQGTGSFEIEFDHYSPITGKIAENIIEQRKKEIQEEQEE